MPTLQTLNDETTPLVMIDGVDPLIFNIYTNRKTRTNREALREIVKGATKPMEKIAREGEKVRAQIAELGRVQEIQDKTAELESALLADVPDAQQVETLRRELAGLEAEAETNLARIEVLIDKVNELSEQADQASANLIAQQLAFFVASTNVKESAAEDAPLVPSTPEFFSEKFDLTTLADFTNKLLHTFDSPLPERRSITS